MAARPGPRRRGAGLVGRLAWTSALVVLALAAACSGSPEDVSSTGVTIENAGSGSPAVDAVSNPAEADGRPDNQPDNGGTAGAAEGEGDVAVADAAPDGAATGTTGAAEDGGSEAAGSGQSPTEAGSSEAGQSPTEAGSSEAGQSPTEAGSSGAGQSPTEAGSSEAGQSPTEAGSSEAGQSPTEAGSSDGGELAFGGAASEGDVEVDPSVIGAFVTGPFAPLTGSLTTDLSLAQRRPLAVKVGNGDPKDRPQAGLAAADIVYEVLVEAGFTRFLAVFHSETPTRIGPVRSARSSDFDILADLATPYLATSGANSTVLREMRQAAGEGTLIDVGAMRMGAPYTRDRSRPSPHNLYFYYENLGGGDADTLPGGLPEAPPAHLFDYGSPNPPGLPDAAGVTVAYKTLYGGEVSHVWDPFLGGWVRIQDGTLHTAETDFGVAEIAPANVIVVLMPYGRSAADRRSPQALSYGSGEAIVLTAGSVHEAQWERTEDRVGFRFTDEAGDPLSLSAGSTWLLLGNTSSRWPLAEVTVLTSSDATRLLADARASAPEEANAAGAS